MGVILLLMFDNFIEDNYHPCDKVYQHKQADNGIYIGDVQSALDIPFLNQAKIKTVVTAAKDMDHIVYDQTITHIVYPLLDGKQENISSFFDNFNEIVQKNIHKGGILVHCAAGISRSSTLVISFIMKQQKIGFKQAIALVRKCRPAVLPNLGFERQLKKYEQGLLLTERQSTHNKRNQIRTSQSGKSHFQFKQELPVIESIQNPKFRRKLVISNVKTLIEKLTEKDHQVLKVYNHARNQSKNKKFLISKKSTSFSRHYDDSNLKNLPFDHIIQSRQYTKNHENDKKKIFKNQLEEMKDIYLSKRNNISVDKRFPTERGATFYLRGKSKNQQS